MSVSVYNFCEWTIMEHHKLSIELISIEDFLHASCKFMPDSQRPVWKEQWCARKDAVESSGGTENQFWITGVSEAFPTPSRPKTGSRSLDPSDYQRPSAAHSKPSISASHPSSSLMRNSQHVSESTTVIPSSRRRVHANMSSQEQPNIPSNRLPTSLIHGRETNRAMRMSTEPYPSYSPSQGDMRPKRGLRVEQGPPFHGQWSQLRGSSYSPNHNSDYGTAFHNSSSSYNPQTASSYLRQDTSRRLTSPYATSPALSHHLHTSSQNYSTHTSPYMSEVYHATPQLNENTQNHTYYGDYMSDQSLASQRRASHNVDQHRQLTTPNAYLQPLPGQIPSLLLHSDQDNFYATSASDHRNNASEHNPPLSSGLESFPNIVEDRNGMLLFERRSNEAQQSTRY